LIESSMAFPVSSTGGRRMGPETNELSAKERGPVKILRQSKTIIPHISKQPGGCNKTIRTCGSRSTD